MSRFRFVLLLVSLSYLASSFSCEGFSNSPQSYIRAHQISRGPSKASRLVVYNAQDDENKDSPQSSIQEEGNKSKLSSARIGGRRKKSSTIIKSATKNKYSRWIPKLIPSELCLPLLSILVIGLLLLRSFFGDGDTSYSYYSYESSVYESRTYGADGQVEVSKKEWKSVKSNIPGMKEQDLSDPNIFSF
jgi:hypothetical protein